jgi:hypothetical protein
MKFAKQHCPECNGEASHILEVEYVWSSILARNSAGQPVEDSPDDDGKAIAIERYSYGGYGDHNYLGDSQTVVYSGSNPRHATVSLCCANCGKDWITEMIPDPEDDPVIHLVKLTEHKVTLLPPIPKALFRRARKPLPA